MEDAVQSPSQEIAQESKTFCVLLWIGTLLFGFIPSLIIYLVKKDDAYIQDQAKEALNWSITVVIGYIASMILMIIVIGAFTALALGVVHLVFCIMGAIGASNGKQFRVPFALRLIK